MARHSYLKNAVILTGTGLLLRAAGMFFRVYVAGKIGAEGMGLYQLVFTVYNMAVTMATAGLSVAATRLTAEITALGNENGVRKAMHETLMLGGILGIGTAFFQYFAADAAAKFWLHDVRAALPLKVLAPSLPFMALSACIRGFFMARRNVVPNSRAQIFEQCVRIGSVALIIGKAIPQGIEAACAAVVLGNTISEASSWIYMEYCYRKELKKLSDKANGAVCGIKRQLWDIMAPIAANQYLSGILRTIENVMVPDCLAAYTLSRETALSQYGALKGMAMPIIFFPFSFLSTLSTLLMPEIAAAHTKKNDALLHRLIARVLLITSVLAIPAGGIFTVFAKELGMLLYKSEEIGGYLRFLGPLMPFMYLESIVDGILKGLGEQLASFRYSVIDSVLRIIMIAALLPRFGMAGFLFVMLVSNLLTSSLNFIRLLRVAKIRPEWMRWIVKPVFSFLFAATAYRFVFVPFAAGFDFSLLTGTLIGAALTGITYLFMTCLTGCIGLKDFFKIFKKKC